ncbi:unnamed protein product [Sphacelaria rigidula]
MARVILDSGSARTSIGVGLLEQMSSQFVGAQLQIPFKNGPQTAQIATGAPVKVTHKTVPITVSVRTPWGAVQLQPITFTVIPDKGNVVIFGVATMKELGIDLHPLALETLPPQRLVDREPDMFMDPAEERDARERALEDSVWQAEQKGVSADGAHCLRDILARRVDIFRCALRGDPPAREEPIKEAVKTKPRRCDSVKTVWLASCIEVLVEFGLLVRNIQAVWASPAMTVPKRDTVRLDSDYQAVNA